MGGFVKSEAAQTIDGSAKVCYNESTIYVPFPIAIVTGFRQCL